ncbi:DNA-binding transcriptional MerR regulator [Paenibacillus sp. SORGH_AS306]|uniref:MerR family transcriptional regulator n=1 Tax=Paenibacillus kyungheensis TaxID=1452732 RepID=A0AAX3M397_9BACL|nr:MULTISPECIES: MerR family transcriptional regulator [Paenibacillus]MDQ1236950.1 DNA-binding transcriptional MerR regulator [Paenibacillus sp. SORGH_AS_0306]MDR6109312.1 DNA-binding transcriptional MerR regulator [Paenibacillus sp. SORGH_AS_0338]WCT56328.1 MerR family transcriptional regulator [Paenibacillus kyungheensis]WDF50558.1 MerR family transcriptional regulator [Paenibacillus sp. KACC 21273]
MTLYKIDEVATACNLTKRTLRYYEEIGLVSPQRSDGGTRLYSQTDIDRLKKIINARDVLGFSLQELQHYVKVTEMLNDQREQYRNTTDEEERRQQLIEMNKTLDQQLHMVDEKLNRIYAFKADAELLRQRIQEGLAKLN